jgi:hypothetical protein
MSVIGSPFLKGIPILFGCNIHSPASSLSYSLKTRETKATLDGFSPSLIHHLEQSIYIYIETQMKL